MASVESGKTAGAPITTTRNAAGVQTIKVSAARSVFFFVDLASKYLKDEPQIELSGLGYGMSFPKQRFAVLFGSVFSTARNPLLASSLAYLFELLTVPSLLSLHSHHHCCHHR